MRLKSSIFRPTQNKPRSAPIARKNGGMSDYTDPPCFPTKPARFLCPGSRSEGALRLPHCPFPAPVAHFGQSLPTSKYSHIRHNTLAESRKAMPDKGKVVKSLRVKGDFYKAGDGARTRRMALRDIGLRNTVAQRGQFFTLYILLSLCGIIYYIETGTTREILCVSTKATKDCLSVVPGSRLVNAWWSCSFCIRSAS